nr:MAG: RNA replicase beta chain [Sanya steitz-like virus 1]UUW21122.1 MAG: RNA replicase beta chain [Sanya steitz-like virus 1]
MLIENVLTDTYSGTTHSSEKSLRADIQTVRKRFFTRGIRFLTEELPSFWKSVLSGLESGTYVRPIGWKSASKSSVLPAFMQGVLKLIFRDDGSLDPGADPYAIQEVAQVCLLLYKLELQSSIEKEEAVLAQFIETEHELTCLSLEEDSALRGARYMLGALFRRFNPLDIVPRHGPGSVATGEVANQKYVFRRKFDSIHSVFPYYTYFTAGQGREIADRIRWYKDLIREPYGTTKIVLVPKDSRGPRLISSEPLEFQWIQGGLGDSIVKHVESHPLTRGRVNFTDQTINQKLALSSSVTRAYATIDLKEASDRVSVDLVRSIFPEKVYRALMAARSDATRINGVELGLTKYAPMGSALCFPVLALTVWALASSVVRQCSNKKGFVYVYGDDLIVPNDCYEAIVDAFPKYGLAVNANKSFSKSFFRESCGMDAFKGIQVTPIKVKKVWTVNPKNGSQYAAYISYLNAFFKRGYWNTFAYVKKQIEAVYGPIPYGTSQAPYPCLVIDDSSKLTELNSSARLRWNNRYHRVEIKVWYPRSREINSPIDGWNRLLKDYSLSNPLNPDLVAVPRTVTNKFGWKPIG